MPLQIMSNRFTKLDDAGFDDYTVMPQSHLLYGGRTVVVELKNRVIPAVAVEILRRRIPMFYRPQGWP